MRALSELYAATGPAPEPGPVEPLALLSAITRSEPAFDPTLVFDRALFGLSADEVRALGPLVPHLCEVAYEALERSAIRFDRLRATRLATWLGSSGGAPWVGRDAARVVEVLGLPGPATVIVAQGAGALLALHTAAQAIRAREADVALVLGEVEAGVGAVVLGRTDRAADEGWRVRALLLGSGVARIGAEPPARTVAAARAGLDPSLPRTSERAGLAGLFEAIGTLEGGTEGREIAVQEAGDTLAVHAIVGPAEQTALGEVAPRMLALSARTPPALQALVRGAAARIVGPIDLAAIAADAVARPEFEHRLAVPIGEPEEVRGRLLRWLEGASGAVEAGRVVEGGVAFVMPPAGVQFAGMADGLWNEPVFRAALERCDRALRPVLPRPLLSVMYPQKGREAQVDDPVFANPLTFALAYGLAELLASRGVRPAAVLGCGVGELVAAVIAGAADLDEAIRLAAERGRLLRTLDVDAARAILLAPEGRVSELVADLPGVDVVSIPTPDRIVIGGSKGAVGAAVERARAAGIAVERLAGNPVHTPLVDPITAELAAAARELKFAPTAVAVVSAATGRRLEVAEAAHWVATLRGPIRLAAAVDATFALGCRTFVELGARPTVLQAGEAALAGQARWFSVLQPGVPDRVALEEVLAGLWVRGLPVARGAAARGPGGAELPTYPWDRRPLDAELEDALADAVPPPRPLGWLPLPELSAEPEATLVPPDELVRMSDASEEALVDLIQLDRPARAPLEPMRVLPPVGEGDEGLSEDSAPLATDEVSDLTFDDLRPLARALSNPPAASTDPTAPMLEDVPEVGWTRTLAEAEHQADSRVVWAEAWVEEPLPEVDPEVGGVTFVILADREGLGDYLAALLEQRGNRILRVLAETPYPRDDGTLFVWDPLAEGVWAHVVDALGTLSGEVRVIDLWGLDGGDEGAPEVATGWPAVAGLVQALAAHKLTAKLHLVTRGAVRTPDPVGAVTGGGLWGIAALLRSETPGLFGGIVDLDPEDEDADALLRHLLHAVVSQDLGRAYAFRDGKRWRRILRRNEQVPAPGAIDASGAWVLAGDVDTALLELGTSLGAAGVKRIYLVSAGPPPADVLRGVLDLQRKGIGCIAVRADPASAKDAETVRQRLAKEERIAGIVVRSAARPVPLVELPIGEGLAQWRRAVATLELLMAIAPDAPIWAWCEGRALDGAAGAGIAAPIAGSLGARLQARGERYTVLHAAPAASFSAGQAVRLLTGLGPAGGVHGAWKA